MAARSRHRKPANSIPIQTPRNGEFFHAYLKICTDVVAMIVRMDMDRSQIRSQGFDVIEVKEASYPFS